MCTSIIYIQLHQHFTIYKQMPPLVSMLKRTLHTYVWLKWIFYRSHQAGFDLTTLSSSLLGGRRRRYHKTMPPVRQFFCLLQAHFSICRTFLSFINGLPTGLCSVWIAKVLIAFFVIDRPAQNQRIPFHQSTLEPSVARWHFANKNPNVGKLWRDFQWQIFVIFYGRLVYFMAIWYI
jgi:hypothetical protein